MKPIELLAISGSLRSVSYNTAVLKAMQQIAPPYIRINLFEQMADLPLFNPDFEENLPPAVTQLKQQLGRADGLIIASPEYAHGISGVMKNALDWLVSGEEFVYKPIALINTSPRATHAQAALREVVTTMSGLIIERASVAVPLLGTHYSADDIIQDESLAEILELSLREFHQAIDELWN